jgi:hypothetical protein
MDDETRRVGKIEAEIAETRVELSETIEAIQQRLAPANLVANATESVRHAATEKVRQMADNSFMDTVRANPIPAAMIGIGAAWLYFKGRGAGGSDRYSNWREAGGYNPGVSGGMDMGGEYPVGTRGTHAYDADRTDYSGESGAMTADLASRARHATDEWRDSARQTTRRAQLKFDDVLRNNPLLLGAAAALAGAAVGMTVPARDTENRLMGEARDAVVDRAQGAASEAASKVSELTESVAGTEGRGRDTGSGYGSPGDSSGASSLGSTGGSDLRSTGGSSFGATEASDFRSGPTIGGSDTASSGGASTSRRSRTTKQT